MLVASCVELAMAYVPPMGPKLGSSPRPASAALFGAAPSLGALVPMVTASPAFADEGGGLVDTIVNFTLSGVILAFVLIIGKYLFDAVTEVGSQAGERAERLGFNNIKMPEKQETVSMLTPVLLCLCLRADRCCGWLFFVTGVR